MYAGMLWVNIGMIISLGLNDTNNYVPLLIALVGFPFASVAGAFVAGITNKRKERKTKYYFYILLIIL